MNKPLKPSDMAKPSDCLCHIEPGELSPLPPPYEDFNQVTIPPLNPEKVKNIETSLDDTVAIGIPKPASKEEEEALVRQFLSGLKKLFEKENNWTFLQPLMLSMEHCAKCQTCSNACPVYEMSGRKEIYRPMFRAEVLRRIYRKYLKPGGKITAKLTGDIDLNWTTIARLAELSYRCTLCRRCATVCPIGVDNALDHARDPQALLPGNGHRPQGAPRKGHRSASPGRFFHRHEPAGREGQRRVHPGRDGRDHGL